MDWRQHNCDGEEQCLSLNYLLFDFSNILRIVKIISCRRNKELNIDMSVHFLFISQKCTFASKRIECCLYMHYAIWRINSRFFGSNCYWLSETYYWHFDDMKLRKINSNRRISDNFRSIQTIHLILMPNGNTVETIDRVSYQFFSFIRFEFLFEQLWWVMRKVEDRRCFYFAKATICYLDCRWCHRKSRSKRINRECKMVQKKLVQNYINWHLRAIDNTDKSSQYSNRSNTYTNTREGFIFRLITP